MEKLRVGVIGVGQMGSLHARVYAQMPNVDLVAIADPQTGNCTRVAESLGVNHTFSNYQDLLKMKGIDAVSICTPDELHRDPVIAAAQAGKHIMLEKPLATELTEAQEIIAVVKETKVKVMVGYLLRFDPRYALVKSAIDRGDLGDIVYILTHRNSPHTEGPKHYKAGTSLTMHVAIHDLDLIGWFMPSCPVDVYAYATTKLLKHQKMHDAATAVFKFEDGAFASVNYSWVLPDSSTSRLDARMEIVGTRGAAYVGVYHEQALLLATERGISAPDVHHSPILSGEVRGDLREEIIAFVNSIINDRAVPISAEGALLSLEMGHGIERSIFKRAPIQLDIQR